MNGQVAGLVKGRKIIRDFRSCRNPNGLKHHRSSMIVSMSKRWRGDVALSVNRTNY
jgi:hypothetical protein